MARSLALLVCLLVFPFGAPGQVVAVKPGKGAAETGVIIEREGSRVVLNVFRTRLPGATHGRKTLTVDPGQEPRTRDAIEVRAWRGIKALLDRDAPVAKWIELVDGFGKEASSALSRRILLEALVAHPGDQALLDRLGKKAETSIASDPRLASGLGEALERTLALPERKARIESWKKEKDLVQHFPPRWLERVARSRAIEKGRKDRLPLTLRAADAPGATYCRFVPSGYDATRPTPLVIGLHGGGPAGQRRDRVAGNGESAMNFYQRLASSSGWLVACPTALRAPWARKENEVLIEALVDEMAMLFNVDRERIYLVGHSMGGFGTWHHGPRLAETWAAIAPAAGGGRPNLQRLQKTLTGVYCHHGADDRVVGVASDRALGDRMLAMNMDFVYCELPDSGHGFPGSVREELWEFFSLRRRATGKGRAMRTTVDPSPSFLEPVSKFEVAHFGDPLAIEEDDDRKSWISRLALGGPRAAEAMSRLVALDGKKAVKALSRCLDVRRHGWDVRRAAARALGELGEESGAKSLQKALSDPHLEVLGAAAEALGRIGGKSGAKRLERAVQIWSKEASELAVGAGWVHADFAALCSSAEGIARGIGALEGEAIGALETLEKTLLDGRQVQTSRRVPQDVAGLRRRVARAIIDAAALGGASGRGILDRLAAHSDARVAEAAAEARGQG